MALDYGTVVTSSVAKQIAENIRQAIVDGQIKIGERLPTEGDLAKSYQVSRPTIREALKRLAAQYLIHSRRGPSGGNFVTRPDSKQAARCLTGVATLLVGLGTFDLSEVFEARQEIETVCIRLAVKVRTEQDLKAMEDELSIQRGNGDPILDDVFRESETRFHRLLVDAAGNAPLSFMMHVVVEAMRPLADMVQYRPGEREKIIELHQDVIDALRARDDKKAIRTLVGLAVVSEGLFQRARLKDVAE